MLVLDLDNRIFVLVDRLPREKRELAPRIGLLPVLAWIVGRVAALFTVLNQEISGRDLILIVGGLFRVRKATHERHGSLEGEEGEAGRAVKATCTAVILQIMVIDLVFSLDSSITAVGMVDDARIMIAAMILSVALMMLFARAIGELVSAHPSIKVPVLSFLVVVGGVLIAEGLDDHVPKGHVDFTVAFSAAAEMLDIHAHKRKAKPVELHSPYREPGAGG